MNLIYFCYLFYFLSGNFLLCYLIYYVVAVFGVLLDFTLTYLDCLFQLSILVCYFLHFFPCQTHDPSCSNSTANDEDGDNHDDDEKDENSAEEEPVTTVEHTSMTPSETVEESPSEVKADDGSDKPRNMVLRLR